MKFFLALVLSFAMVFATVPTAKADNSEEVIIGVLGGALGGLLVGSIVGGSRERTVIRERQVYEDYYEPVVTCYVRKVRVYDPYTDRYIYVKRRVCN